MAKQHGEFESVRAAILETAAKLFTSRGIHEASLADIAKDAKLSKGTIYYYYPSKDHLINDISDYHFGRITDMIFVWIETLARNTEPRDALSVIFEAFTEDESIYKLHMVLCLEAMQGNVSLQKKLAAKYREWTVMIEVGSLKLASPASERLRKLSQAFMAMIDGFILQSNLGIDGLTGDMLVGLILGELD